MALNKSTHSSMLRSVHHGSARTGGGIRPNVFSPNTTGKGDIRTKMSPSEQRQDTNHGEVGMNTLYSPPNVLKRYSGRQNGLKTGS
jgi:hypothetical protein